MTTAASTADRNASQLRLGFFGSGVGNPGQAVTAVRVTDTSSFPCSLRGHPVVTFLGKAGAIMRVTVEQAPSSVFYGAVRTIVLPPRRQLGQASLLPQTTFRPKARRVRQQPGYG